MLWSKIGLATFLDKKTADDAVKNKIMWNKELAVELRKLTIGKFEKGKIHSSFIDTIWGADLADMLLSSKFDKGICFLLCVIDIYSIFILTILVLFLWKIKNVLQLLMLFKKH